MLLNPNNHALDGGPATAEMEKDAVAQIAAMFGYEQHLGHLTASGTIANLEALWVARELHPDAAIVSGANAHYTHARVSAVLGARHETVPQDAAGPDRPRRARASGCAAAASARSSPPRGPPRWAPSTTSPRSPTCAPSTARGCMSTRRTAASSACSPTAASRASRRAPFEAIARADSIVVDPHKHGLQPYGCGCVVFADPGVGRLYAHDSPYTYFTSDALHLGEISLECSRAGAAAAALWTTLRALPLTRDGARPPRSAPRGPRRSSSPTLLDADERTELLMEPELDIVCVRSATDPGRRGARVRHARAGRLARREAAPRRRGDRAALLPAQAGARRHRTRAGGRAGRASDTEPMSSVPLGRLRGMTISDILDAVSPGDDAQALALMLIVGACEQASSLMLDDVPRLVSALCRGGLTLLLEGRNAVIHGGGGSVGGAVGRAFAREGATVHLAGRTQAKLDTVAEEIRAAGGAVQTASGRRARRARGGCARRPGRRGPRQPRHLAVRRLPAGRPGHAAGGDGRRTTSCGRSR